MDVKRDIKDKIVSYYQHTQENPEVEMEAIVRQGKINKAQFTSLLQYFRSVQPPIPFKFHEESLSINFNYKNLPYRLDITGKNEIGAYCKTNDVIGLQKTSLMSKSWVRGKGSIIVDDYDMKINLKNEHVIDPVADKSLIYEIKKNLYSVKKTYRYKRRFSFFTDDGLFRYDFTIVKSSSVSTREQEGYVNLLSSGIFQTDEKFEVEIELLRPEQSKSWPSPDQFVTSLFGCHGIILSVLDEDDHIIGISKKKTVLEEYQKVCGTNKFIGPKPITLELKNLLPAKPGIDSVMKDYTVTDKADGERHLLFIDGDGKVYLINNRLSVRFTGVSNDSFKKSVVDGEFITRTKSGNSIKLFMAFDVYFDRGENVSHLPLWTDKDNKKGFDASKDSRLKRMNLISSSKYVGDKTFKIEAKEFLDGDNENILKSSRKIYDLFEIGNMRYKIDGLIYTPKFNPVGGYHEDSKVAFGTTWIKVFKWKPPEDNSIDFLVETEKNSAGSDIVDNNSKILKLYVGYRVSLDQKVTPLQYLTNNITPATRKDNYQKRLFSPPNAMYDTLSRTHIELDDNNVMKAESGEVIYDGDVVEFAFKDKNWIPLRLRKDKKQGNDYAAAVNIWQSITHPVTKDMIKGIKELHIDETEAFDDDLYYNRQEDRRNSASKSMLDFHNYWVKNMSMVHKFKGKATSVFDIACGKGGDFDKYKWADFKVLVGVDKSEDNIVNPNDGAYARLLPNEKNKWKSPPNDMRIVYLPMDCSKVWDTSLIEAIPNKDVKTIAELVWGLTTVPTLERYHGLAKKKFELVTCQFAIHYFFVNHATLDALIDNIDSVIADGGYFMGTCLDGGKVDKKFREKGIPKGECIQGVKENSNRVIWNICKQYDTFHTSTQDDVNGFEKNFGLQIEVYMETINQRLKEYLVDFNLLKAKLAQKNIRPLVKEEWEHLGLSGSDGSFKELFDIMQQQNHNAGNNPHRQVQSALQMTQVEKEYSFLNKWFVFRKGTIDIKKQKSSKH